MVKGVPSEGWDSFFVGGQCQLHISVGADLCVRPLGRTRRCAPIEQTTGGTPVPLSQLLPRLPLLEPGLAGKPHEEGGQYIMVKSKSSKVKPISIRYTCAPNGDQVGLSHYLMADAKKAK